MSMKHFLTECETNDRMTLIIGQCGGGKTHLMLGTMKDHLKNNRFTQYHCVIPAYHMERSGSYDFIKNTPEYKKYVFVYNEYHPRISETLLNSQSEGIENGNAEHIFYFIDDATGEEKIWNDEFLIKIACKTRHLRISLFYCDSFTRSKYNTTVRSFTITIYFFSKYEPISIKKML